MVRKKKKKTMKGAFTLEAVFLVPILLAIMVIIMFTFFYLYDAALIQGAAYQAALRGARMYDLSDGEVKRNVEKIAKDLVEDRVLYGTVQSKVEVSFTKVSVTYEVTIDSPVSKFLSYVLVDYDFQHKVTKSSYRASGVDYIQIYQIVEHGKK